MSDLFDTSKIRDQPEYWDALAERVTAHAVRSTSAFGQIAESRAGWVAAGLAVAAAIVLMLLPPNTPADAGASWTAALAPSDAVGKAITSPDRPPNIGALLLGDQTTGGAR
jgi:hypothetical protein